jgi:uncharacterized protein (TIGR02611 family)
MAEQREGPPAPKAVEKLRARRDAHLRRGRIYRGAFVVAGTIVLVAGVAMLALPGPAFVVIPVGLAILSLEFAWAERLLEAALRKGDEAKRKAAEASPAKKVLSAIATGCAIAAAVAAAIVWDIPLLPV